MRRHHGWRALALILFVVGWTDATRAQGLRDAVTASVAPTPQAAAVDDVYAAWVNPAGLAFVDAFQLGLGYAAEFGPRPQDSLFGHAAFSAIDGLTLGAGGGFMIRPEGFGIPYQHLSGTAALRLDRSFAIGGALRSIRNDDGSEASRVRSDVGLQLRPASWLALGATLENLGAEGTELGAMRLGLSTRPFGEAFTFGLDTRVESEAPDWFAADTYSALQFTPALNAVLRMGGIAVTGGASWRNIGAAAAADLEFGVGVQLDTHHVGAAFTGGVVGADRFQGTVLSRISAERFATLLPTGQDWVALTLVGDGVELSDPDGVIEALFAPEGNPVEVLAALERAAKDPEIAGVLLRLRGLSLGFGRLTELRRRIEAVRAAGKSVFVHLDAADDGDIYLATAADQVFVSPAGDVELNGLQVVLSYFGATLARFGIAAEAVVAGDFKSAPRTFTANEPNEAELLVQNELLDATYETLVQGIAKGRGVEPLQVEQWIDRGGMTAPQAVEAKLIDGLAYFDEMPDRIEAAVGYRPFLRRRYVDQRNRLTAWEEPKQIAVIPITGTIAMGRSGGGPLDIFESGAGADDIIEALERAERDPSILAVVLRIDSPGGDALASDLIWHAVMRVRQEKPVVASMGDVAASGGYYIASGAQEIFAEPDTITGSIGVFALFFQAAGLFSDLSVGNYELQRGANPGPSLHRGLREHERKQLQARIDAAYERFLEAIKAGRTIDDAKLRDAAEGRVFTGAAAKERGLVDTLGGLLSAVARARELAGVPASETTDITILSSEQGFVPRIQTAVRALTGANASQAQVRAALRAVLGDEPDPAVLTAAGRPLALPPARIRIE